MVTVPGLFLGPPLSWASPGRAGTSYADHDERDFETADAARHASRHAARIRAKRRL
ncbi:hypothetical protein [Streptomyces sp. NBC_01538]|uniref:hypothetical protein n=1 Tax=Streptomyces sp. NBC_01538 TaxID=2903897 RepID=UPI00386842E4